jgi:hypothetical protein
LIGNFFSSADLFFLLTNPNRYGVCRYHYRAVIKLNFPIRRFLAWEFDGTDSEKFDVIFFPPDGKFNKVNLIGAQMLHVSFSFPSSIAFFPWPLKKEKLKPQKVKFTS